LKKFEMGNKRKHAKTAVSAVEAEKDKTQVANEDGEQEESGEEEEETPQATQGDEVAAEHLSSPPPIRKAGALATARIAAGSPVSKSPNKKIKLKEFAQNLDLEPKMDWDAVLNRPESRLPAKLFDSTKAQIGRTPTAGDLLWMIYGQVAVIRQLVDRNTEQTIDLTHLSSKLDEMKAETQAVKKEPLSNSPLDQKLVAKVAGKAMSENQAWPSFGNSYWGPLQVKTFGPEGNSNEVTTVRPPSDPLKDPLIFR